MPFRPHAAAAVEDFRRMAREDLGPEATGYQVDFEAARRARMNHDYWSKELGDFAADRAIVYDLACRFLTRAATDAATGSVHG